jgi:hypothetical protein
MNMHTTRDLDGRLLLSLPLSFFLITLACASAGYGSAMVDGSAIGFNECTRMEVD